MKKSILMPTLATLLLVGASGLVADTVKGEAAAKAKVAEFTTQESHQAKKESSKFKQDAINDVKKLDDSAEVKAIEAKDKVEAKTKTKAFQKEAHEDQKKMSR